MDERAAEDSASGAGEPAGDQAEAFRADLTRRLGQNSVRAIAVRAHWGRTVVHDIKSGRRLPTLDQLDALLKAVGADEAERSKWRDRWPGRPGAHSPSLTETLPRTSTEAGQAHRARASQLPSREPAKTPPHLQASTEVGPGRGRRRLLVGGGVVALAGAGAGLWLGLAPSLGVDGKSLTAGGPRTATQAESSATGSAVTGRIEKPQDGRKISSSAGVQLSGTAGPAQPNVWLIDRDADGYYTPDEPVEYTSDGRWQGESVPVGDAEELPQLITILLVTGDEACTTFLKRRVLRDDSTFEKLPATCRALDEVNVVVARE